MGVVGTVHVAVLVRAAVSEAAADWLSPTLLSLVTLRSAPVLAVDVADDAFAAPAQAAITRRPGGRSAMTGRST
jgi:hypothetical protein